MAPSGFNPEGVALRVVVVRKMAVWVSLPQRVVPYIAVQIQRLRVGQIGVRHRDRTSAPVRGHEPCDGSGVPPGSEVVQTGVGIALLAGELVVLRTGIDRSRLLPAERKVVGVVADMPGGIHNHARGPQMIVKVGVIHPAIGHIATPDGGRVAHPFGQQS